MTRRRILQAFLSGLFALAASNATGVATAMAAPATVDSATTVGEIPAPPGYTRDPVDAWGAWLAALALQPAGSPVLDYRGNPLAMPALRVVELPLVPGDLQQCADSILRLRATWVRDQGGDPAFRYTSGWMSRWSAWQEGVRPVVKGSTVTTRNVTPSTARDASFEHWLTDLFMYAGTFSLKVDTAAVKEGPAAVRAGDVVMFAGSPGHAVVVLAVARAGGETVVLVGQGYMPAMSFHVVEGPVDGWFPVEGESLLTVPLAVPWSGLRRFPE